MNWIKISLVFLFLGLFLSASAQYTDVHTAKRRGARIELDGQKLSTSESALLMADINGEDYSAQWTKARRWRNAGVGMISGGAVLAAGGALLSVVGATTSLVGATAGALTGAIGGSITGSGDELASQGAEQGIQAGKPLLTAGLLTFIAGMGINLAGIPVTVVNRVKMNRLVDQYNEAQIKKAQPTEAQLSFGLTPNGIGLSLNF